MENTSENNERHALRATPMSKKNAAAAQQPFKYITTAVLAHVDAGKTTLSEAMLYVSGNIRKAGRVDNGDAFLDTDEMERARGITIFSSQAVLKLPGGVLTLLDTPGHVDFSAEMERTLSVLDCAILVISGADGVQEHTKTLWRLLRHLSIPAFLFVNKMDQAGADQERLFAQLRRVLSENCVDFSDRGTDTFYENAAVCDETALEEYLENGTVSDDTIAALIGERKLFPCFFGSARKMEGVSEFLEAFFAYAREPEYPAAFGAKVYKITRDAQGVRLTHMKITGGSLAVKQLLSGVKRGGAGGGGESEIWEEKVNQIRIYSGERYETTDAVTAGRICTVTGLNETYPGEGLGVEEASEQPVLEPVLTYRILPPEGVDAALLLPKLRLLEEEEPQLQLVWDEKLRGIFVRMMGEVQLEVLKSRILTRFGMEVTFGAGHVVYRETIADTVEGVGHFEPLRHYAEVHLKLEPGEPGSGMQFSAACSEDVLDKNWQRLILTHLREREHRGVLTGAAVTDMKITLVSGKAHLKHTEGGDFRQATYRAVRQGLMRAKSVLLEPYYDFVLEVPEQSVGRAMTDVERMHGEIRYGEGWEETDEAAAGEPVLRRLVGSAPVAAMQNYQKEVLSYTKGQGRLTVSNKGYFPCHNADEVTAALGYDAAHDTEHTPDSVFCAHGAGFVVPWDQVTEYMHLPGIFAETSQETQKKTQPESSRAKEEAWLGTEEIDRILAQASGANRGTKEAWKKSKGRREQPASAVTRTYRPNTGGTEYLLVDGYNIIFAWEELAQLAKETIDGARGKLLDILCNYQGIRGCELIVVFDAYRVAGHRTEILDYHNIHVVYTKEAETADAYIEKFAHEHAREHRVTVATSDGLEQIIIRGAGCLLLSARELLEEVARAGRQMMEAYEQKRDNSRAYLLDGALIKGFLEEKEQEGE